MVLEVPAFPWFDLWHQVRKKKSNVVPSSIVRFLLCVLLLSWRHHMICINLRLDPPLCVTDRLPATGCYLSPLLSETLSPSCFFFSPASRLFKGLRNGLISVWLCGCAFVACDHRACFFFFFFNAFLLQSRCRAELHVSVQMATLARGKRAATHTHTRIYFFIYSASRVTCLFLPTHLCNVRLSLSLSLTCLPSAALPSHPLSRVVAPWECRLRFFPAAVPRRRNHRSVREKRFFFPAPDCCLPPLNFFFFWVSPGIWLMARKRTNTLTHVAF